MTRVYYRPTEKAARMRKLMSPFFQERGGLTKTAFNHYKVVPHSQTEDTIEELLRAGLIEEVER